MQIKINNEIKKFRNISECKLYIKENFNSIDSYVIIDESLRDIGRSIADAGKTAKAKFKSFVSNDLESDKEVQRRKVYNSLVKYMLKELGSGLNYVNLSKLLIKKFGLSISDFLAVLIKFLNDYKLDETNIKEIADILLDNDYLDEKKVKSVIGIEEEKPSEDVRSDVSNDKLSEVVSGLKNLGYTSTEIKSMISNISEEDLNKKSVEDLIKYILSTVKTQH